MAICFKLDNLEYLTGKMIVSVDIDETYGMKGRSINYVQVMVDNNIVINENYDEEKGMFYGEKRYRNMINPALGKQLSGYNDYNLYVAWKWFAINSPMIYFTYVATATFPPPGLRSRLRKFGEGTRGVFEYNMC